MAPSAIKNVTANVAKRRRRAEEREFGDILIKRASSGLAYFLKYACGRVDALSEYVLPESGKGSNGVMMGEN